MANRAERRRQAREAKKNAPVLQRAEQAREKESEIRQIMADLRRDGYRNESLMRANAELHQEVLAKTRENIVSALGKNGIGVEDLQREYDRGREDGFRQAGLNAIQCCYAGMCIALHDVFGFGKKRCYRVLKACDEKVAYVLGYPELADEVLEKTGISIDFGDPLERVQMKD